MRAIDRYDNGKSAFEIYDINILEALRLAESAWTEVDTTTIRNCWRKAGILPDFDPTPIPQQLISIQSLLNGDNAMDNPLVAGQTARLLAAVAADTFGVEPLVATRQDRSDPRVRTLRRAIAFIEAHPDRDLTVSDIAEAACVTPRTSR